jgi:hypothetical protein
LASFLSRIDGGINGVAWELKVCQWRRERRALVLFLQTETGRKKERAVGRRGKRYKYPLGPNGHLSAALPLSRCGTAAPTKIAKRKS